MGRISKLLDWVSGRPENALYSGDTNPADWGALQALLGESTKGTSGVKVSHKDAFKLGSVAQAVRTIGSDIAISTLQLHDNDAKPGEESIKKNHPSHHVSAIRWSRYQSAFECWRRLAHHALIWGNGYAYIKRDSRGRILWMANLLPGCVERSQHDFGNGEIPCYLVVLQDGEGEVPFAVMERDIFHLRGAISLEDCDAEDPILYMRDTISIKLGAQKFQGSFFSSGAQAGGIISVPAGVPTGARERLEEQIQKKSNAENWFKTMVLRDGAQWHQTTVDAKSAEMIAVEEAVVREIARFFNMPPFKLGIADSVSYNSSTVGQQVYLNNCLNPWLKAIASEAHLKFLPNSEQLSGRYRFEHNTSKLVEPDVQTMNEILEIQRRNEIINANDWRRKINLPARSDAEANKYLNPNTRAADSMDEPEEPKTEVQNKLFREAVERVNKRVTTPLCNRAKRPSSFLQWLDSEAADHRSIFQQELGTLSELLYGDDAEIKLRAMEKQYFTELLDRVRVYTEPPYVESNLVSNITRECELFSQTISHTLEQDEESL